MMLALRPTVFGRPSLTRAPECKETRGSSVEQSRLPDEPSVLDTFTFEAVSTLD